MFGCARSTTYFIDSRYEVPDYGSSTGAAYHERRAANGRHVVRQQSHGRGVREQCPVVSVAATGTPRCSRSGREYGDAGYCCAARAAPDYRGPAARVRHHVPVQFMAKQCAHARGPRSGGTSKSADGGTRVNETGPSKGVLRERPGFTAPAFSFDLSSSRGLPRELLAERLALPVADVAQLRHIVDRRARRLGSCGYRPRYLRGLARGRPETAASAVTASSGRT